MRRAVTVQVESGYGDAQASRGQNRLTHSFTVPYPPERSLQYNFDELGTETIPGHAIPLEPSAVREFLKVELSTEKLSSIYNYLWICGRRNHIHALHWHRMMSRDILVTEDPSLHLVWYRSKILIKPLPRCLLVHKFWKSWVCHEPSEEKGSLFNEWKENTWKEANGLLWTYVHLIVHETDFRIARDLNLIPDDLTWSNWSRLRLDITDALSGNAPDVMTLRYHYGELRLGRLDLVYHVFRFQVLGYHYIHRDYNEFFGATFGWMLLIFAYASVASGAFQTAMSADNAPQSLKDVGYWFSVALLLLIVLGVLVQAGLLVGLFIYHLLATLAQPRRARSASHR